MKYNSFFRRGVSALIALVLMVGFAVGQNLILNGSSTNLGGTWRVKGNVDNTNSSGANTFTGTVELKGTANQTIGGHATNAINFATVKATAVSTKDITVNSTVSTLIDVAANTTTKFVLAANKKLSIGTAITNSVPAAAPYDFTASGAEVDYTNGTSNTVYSTSYNKLTMSGGGTFSIASGGATVAGALSHTGGALTVNNNLTASSTYAIATIADIGATASLTLGTTGTIATITDITSGGNLINGSGLLTVTNLTNNHGSITALANDGAITFTAAATNTGNIVGGDNAVTFSNTLAHSTGTITSGPGGVVFSGTPTLASGATITSAGGTLDFNAAVDGAVGTTISLSSTGTANFSNSFTNVPTLTFAATSTVNFDGAAQTVPATAYGILNMSGSSTKTALGAITVNGAFTNNVTTDMSTFTLTLNSTKTNNGTMQFGGTNNGVFFADGTVEYNAESGDQIIRTSGAFPTRYSTLVLSGAGSKTVATAEGDVTSNLGLTVGSAVNLIVEASRTLFVAYTSGNLQVDGTVTNSGTIEVGN